MNRLIRLAAVVIPAVGLAGLWATSHQTYQQGTEWEVPIQGYDPRDYLRGHYVEFTYDWPGIDEFGDVAPPPMLCLEGTAPNLTRVTGSSDAPCAHPIRADVTGVYGWDALTRGRLYLGQDRAMALQGELQERGQRGIVTIRQREDGSFTPISIRFRALTPAEEAERQAQDAAIFPPDGVPLPESSGNPPPSPQSEP
jgi:GDYXXLXY protein